MSGIIFAEANDDDKLVGGVLGSDDNFYTFGQWEEMVQIGKASSIGKLSLENDHGKSNDSTKR